MPDGSIKSTSPGAWWCYTAPREPSAAAALQRVVARVRGLECLQLMGGLGFLRDHSPMVLGCLPNSRASARSPSRASDATPCLR
eukprot:CAMPEP_0195587636 /NCGR_PEP_ID=MMETSP0814-20130614/31307_1 /TAXON_ID=97485 /ORGANISM="Prymnesium parvum, Strain Texoma1" /LENGTH=83 /DNA_ID=CAMNT_0040726439 /DNA_START=185 /DNA_END=432 /DNA_ORIENTATION=+